MTLVKQIKLFALTFMIFSLNLSSSASAAMAWGPAWEDEGHSYQFIVFEKYMEGSDANVTMFNQLCSSFHKANWIKTAPELRFPSSEQEYDAFSKGITTSRAQMFKEGKARLLLIYKDGTMVGGTYLLENNGLLRISCAGFNLSSPTEAMKLQQKMIEFLSSSKNFPNTKKLITCVSKTSILIPLLQMHGFSVSNEAVEEDLSKDIFVVFEREIK